jgi:hypothetical protein
MVRSRKILWVLSLITRYVLRQFYSSIPGWPAATVTDHEARFEGMRSGDTAKTRASMTSHFIHSGELLAANFDKRVVAPTFPATDAETSTAMPGNEPAKGFAARCKLSWALPLGGLLWLADPRSRGFVRPPPVSQRLGAVPRDPKTSCLRSKERPQKALFVFRIRYTLIATQLILKEMT